MEIKKNWKYGATVTEDDMNRIEKNIEEVSDSVAPIEKVDIDRIDDIAPDYEGDIPITKEEIDVIENIKVEIPNYEGDITSDDITYILSQ
jgi:hypothetical protein